MIAAMHRKGLFKSWSLWGCWQSHSGAWVGLFVTALAVLDPEEQSDPGMHGDEITEAAEPATP